MDVISILLFIVSAILIANGIAGTGSAIIVIGAITLIIAIYRVFVSGVTLEQANAAPPKEEATIVLTKRTRKPKEPKQ